MIPFTDARVTTSSMRTQKASRNWPVVPTSTTVTLTCCTLSRSMPWYVRYQQWACSVACNGITILRVLTSSKNAHATACLTWPRNQLGRPSTDGIVYNEAFARTAKLTYEPVRDRSNAFGFIQVRFKLAKRRHSCQLWNHCERRRCCGVSLRVVVAWRARTAGMSIGHRITALMISNINFVAAPVLACRRGRRVQRYCVWWCMSAAWWRSCAVQKLTWPLLVARDVVGASLHVEVQQPAGITSWHVRRPNDAQLRRAWLALQAEQLVLSSARRSDVSVTHCAAAYWTPCCAWQSRKAPCSIETHLKRMRGAETYKFLGHGKKVAQLKVKCFVNSRLSSVWKVDAPGVGLEHIGAIRRVRPELPQHHGPVVAPGALRWLRLVLHQLAVLDEHVPAAWVRFSWLAQASTHGGRIWREVWVWAANTLTWGGKLRRWALQPHGMCKESRQWPCNYVRPGTHRTAARRRNRTSKCMREDVRTWNPRARPAWSGAPPPTAARSTRSPTASGSCPSCTPAASPCPPEAALDTVLWAPWGTSSWPGHSGGSKFSWDCASSIAQHRQPMICTNCGD